eukprot:4162540-Amphidinium_carterae.1
MKRPDNNRSRQVLHGRFFAAVTPRSDRSWSRHEKLRNYLVFLKLTPAQGVSIPFKQKKLQIKINRSRYSSSRKKRRTDNLESYLAVPLAIDTDVL